MAGSGTLSQAAGGTQADAGSRLSRLLMDLVALPPEDDAPEAPRLVPGEHLDRFEIRAVLGEGGFGTVYEGWDGELGRAVALKTLRTRRRRDVPIDLLRKEAEAVAKLNHPGIVTLYDLCAGPQGHYLVMERLEGRTLAEHLRERGALPWKDAVRLAGDLAEALSHAHARGLLHRDLKPSNVFLCGDGRAKLLDFGLAYVLGSGSGSSGGTPAYMAPEQARGELVDARADVYALGLVIAETITGLRAHTGDLLEATKARELPPLKGVPRRLARLVAEMTAPDPDARPRDGAEVAAALTTIRRSVEQRRPRLVLAGTVALAALSVTAALHFRPARLPSGRLLVAMADLENQAADPALDGLGTLFGTALEQSRRVSLMDRARVADLAAKGPERPKVIGEDEAVSAGKLASAQLALIPTVRQVTGGLELAVRALDLQRGGAAIFGLKELAATRDGLYASIDRLAVRVRRELAEDATEVPVKTTSVAEYAPADLEALRLHEEGERLQSSYDYPGAQKKWEEAVARDPGFPLPRLALLQGRLGVFTMTTLSPEATREHLRVLRRDLPRLPEGHRAWAETVLIRIEGGYANHTEYLAALDRAIAARPEQPAPYIAAGIELLHVRGDAATARPYLDRAVQVSPLAGLGDVLDFLILSERYDEAVEAARRWVELAPGAPSHTNLVVAHLARGETDLALDLARKDLARFPGSIEAFKYATVVAGAFEEWDAVRARWRPRPEAPPEPLRPHALAERGRVREALAMSDAQLAATHGDLDQLCSGLSAWHDTRMRILLVRGDRDELARAVRAAHGDCGTWDAYAWFLAEAGALDESARMALSDRLLGIRIAHALWTWKKGDREAALAAFAGIAAAPAALHQGEILAELGRHREAVEAYRRYRRLRMGGLVSTLLRYFDTALLPRTYYLEAVSLEALGEREEARRALDWLLRWWKDADPDLPLLVQAKELERRLGP